MTTARKLQVDPNITPFYHCISRCVRGTYLCQKEDDHRKQWIEDRLKELVEIFAVDVCAFSIADNELHVLLRLDMEKAQAWTPQEVLRRWLLLCPARDRYGRLIAVSRAWMAERANDPDWIQHNRDRLCEIGWFMKAVKEQIARNANKEDGCTGAFWQGRFRSISILDPASLLATCVSLDVDPAESGIETSAGPVRRNSIQARIEYCTAQGKLDVLRGISPASSRVNLEKGHWLLPIEDRRNASGKGAPGMLPEISLPEYVKLVEWTSHLIRPGNDTPPTDVPEILNELQIEIGGWKRTLANMVSSSKKIGTYFGSTDRLNEVAAYQGCKFIKNSGGRLAPLNPIIEEAT